MLKDSFPHYLQDELSIVLNVIPKTTYNNVTDYCSKYTIEYFVDDYNIKIPYRIYFIEPKENDVSKLSYLQKMILYCIYTRSCDGYLREKYIRKLLKCNYEKWCIPYIVKLCDEYLIEIIEIIYDFLKEKDNTDIKEFCLKNKENARISYARMTSYWDRFYRYDVNKFHDYVGRRLFRECFGYNRSFEK